MPFHIRRLLLYLQSKHAIGFIAEAIRSYQTYQHGHIAAFGMFRPEDRPKPLAFQQYHPAESDMMLSDDDRSRADASNIREMLLGKNDAG